jgi:hypothetical protein
MSIMEIIQAAGAAVAAAQQMAEKKDFAEWQDRVSSRLDLIYANTERILADLRQLRVDFKEALRSEFRDSFQRQLEAKRRSVDNIVAGLRKGEPLSSRDVTRMQDIAESLRSLLYTTSSYGLATFPFVVSGYATLLPAMVLGNYAKGEVESTRRTMQDTYFLPAIAKDKTGSFAWALDQARANEAQLLARISADTRIGTVGATGVVPCSSNSCTMQLYTTTVNGNPSDPSSFKRLQVVPTTSMSTPQGAEYTTLGSFWVGGHSNLDVLQPKPFTLLGAVVGDGFPLKLADADVAANGIVEALRAMSMEYVAERNRVASLERAIAIVKALMPRHLQGVA